MGKDHGFFSLFFDEKVNNEFLKRIHGVAAAHGRLPGNKA